MTVSNVRCLSKHMFVLKTVVFDLTNENKSKNNLLAFDDYACLPVSIDRKTKLVVVFHINIALAYICLYITRIE